ncbi:MAG: hypothetical protein ACI4MN_05305 [Candidatus Coproplasma sp.]
MLISIAESSFSVCGFSITACVLFSSFSLKSSLPAPKSGQTKSSGSSP